MDQTKIQQIIEKKKKLQAIEVDIKNLKKMQQKLNKVEELFDRLKFLSKINQIN